MKKFIAIIAAIALIATMSVVAFAYNDAGTDLCDDNDTVGNPLHVDGLNIAGDNNVKDVYVTLTGDIMNVICVDVAWGAMTFTYDGDLTWNPHDHEYVATEGVAGVWAPSATGADKITLKNHSDVPVTVKGAFATTDEAGKATNVGAVTATIADVNMNACTISADGYTATPVDGEMTVAPAGVPTVATREGSILVGAVTLTVAEKTA